MTPILRATPAEESQIGQMAKGRHLHSGTSDSLFRLLWRSPRRPNGAVVVEEGKIGVTDLAVFYPADHQLALAVVHFLNGNFGEAERLRGEWLAERGEPLLVADVPCITPTTEQRASVASSPHQQPR